MKIQLKIQNLRHPSIVPKPASGVHWILCASCLTLLDWMEHIIADIWWEVEYMYSRVAHLLQGEHRDTDEQLFVPTLTHMTILNHHLSNIFGLWEETRPLGRKTNQRNHEGATHMQSPNRRTPKHNSQFILMTKIWDKPNFCHKYKSVALKWPWLCLK